MRFGFKTHGGHRRRRAEQSSTGQRKERMKESRNRKMTGGSEGKMIFLQLFSAENSLFIRLGVLQTKLCFYGVMETKLSFVICAAQNHTFVTCHGQISPSRELVI
jgi:hypothetical protein